ncbi:MAG: MBL fold metallo-hydrolase [Oscillospiraceae bacterium]|nr:MBL fold metallo-hydrolase [Oscillospiraceae bacterium]
MELIFKTEKVTDNIKRIYAFNTELMYLVEGSERAVLIDTGSGFGSLKACVDTLTDKPLTVLLTHGHTDHALGAAEFEDVRISPLEARAYAVHSPWAFRAGSGTMWPDFDKLNQDQIIGPMPFEKMKSLAEGEVFSLGGVSVETFACPGHTEGSLVFLIPEERMLLLGDACNYMVFLFDELSLPVSSYKKALSSLLDKVKGRYDTILLSHGDGVGVPDMIERVIEVCDDILEGRSDKAPFNFLGTEAMMAHAMGEDRRRLDGGVGNIVYSAMTLG